MSGCLSHDELAALRNGKHAATLDMKRHLDGCEVCRAALEHTPDRAAETMEAPPRAPVPRGPEPTASSEPYVAVGGASQHFPKIEGYRIDRVLGQGGMGIVYRAVQTKLSRTVALKVLPAMMGSANPSAVSRFRREATAAARLHHTNIIPIHDFGESRDAYYYAMDLIVGQPLNVLIRRLAGEDAPGLSAPRLVELLRDGNSEVTSPSLVDSTGTGTLDDSPSKRIGSTSSGRGRAYYEQVARWMADAADALHYAHSQGIIHRDVKPANLILSVDGRIMVADFGLAKSVDEESMTMTGAMLGSLRYVSPEQAMAKRVRVDHRTDIYSLGTTLYELLCFQPAFPGTDEKAILGAIIARDPTPPRKVVSSVPEELETICLKTLEKLPEGRYATARALAEDLRRYIQDLPIAAKRPGMIKRAYKLVRRHKARTIAVAAALLLAASTWIAVLERNTRNAAQRRELVSRLDAIKQRVKNAGILGHWEEADAELSDALVLGRGDEGTWLLLAWARLEQNKIMPAKAASDALLEAERAAREALQLNPNSGEALSYLSVTLRRMERYPEAIEALRRVIEIDDASFKNWSNLGTCYLQNRDLPRAEECMRKGADRTGPAKDAARAAAWRNLASLELFLRRPAAIESIGQAIDRHEFDPLAWAVQSRVLMELPEVADFPRAHDDAEHADRLARSKSPAIKRVLALAHLRTDQFEEAIIHARSALELHDLPTGDLLIVAVAEAKRGRKENARAALEAADAGWPEELKVAGGFLVSAEAADVWIESADDWLGLRAEAENLLR